MDRLQLDPKYIILIRHPSPAASSDSLVVCDDLAGGVSHDAAPDGRADAELEPGHEDGGAADTARYEHSTWPGVRL